MNVILDICFLSWTLWIMIYEYGYLSLFNTYHMSEGSFKYYMYKRRRKLFTENTENKILRWNIKNLFLENTAAVKCGCCSKIYKAALKLLSYRVVKKGPLTRFEINILIFHKTEKNEKHSSLTENRHGISP